MHVALVVERYTKAGGQERAVCAFAEGLASRHRLSIIAGSAETELPSGVELLEVGAGRGPEVMRFRHFVRAAERVARRGGFDLVHGIGANCAVADVVHLQTVNREKYALLGAPGASGRGPLKRLAFSLYLGAVDRAERRALGRTGPLYVAVSRRVGAEAERWFGVNPRDLRLLPNGYDPAVFSVDRARRARGEARARLGLGENDVSFLFVGPDHERKGLPTLMAAFAQTRIPGARLLVAGGPRSSQREYATRAEAAGLGGRVVFLEHTPDPLPAYAAADVFVLPTRYDPFGMVVIEAMACGLPVLLSSCAGITEYLAESEYVRLADPTDVDELKMQLELLAGDAGRRRTLAQAGLTRSREFTWARIVPRLEVVYEESFARRQAMNMASPKERKR